MASNQYRYYGLRKEERERRAKIRADQYSHPVEWNDCYHHWIEGAEWADKTMLDKVCEWVKKHYMEYAHNSMGSEYIIKDLINAMEQ